jgi:hypothetical protein
MTLARAANRVWDRGDMERFDLLASLSGRDQDQAIRNIPTEELEAVLPKHTNTTPAPERAA